MTGVMLDIGAGSKKFTRLFRRYNPQLPWQFLCGDISFKGEHSGVVRPRSIKAFHARYDAFGVPDGSLTCVTLNAYHPLSPPRGVEFELARTLKSGGAFISAHPVGSHPMLTSSYFTPVEFAVSKDAAPRVAVGFWHKSGWLHRPSVVLQVPSQPIGSIIYPASPTICSRIRELRLPKEFRPSAASGYMYGDRDYPPTLRVWVRNERPYNEKTTST